MLEIIVGNILRDFSSKLNIAIKDFYITAEMSDKKVVFDIIGTCFSLEQPRQRLIKLGAPAYALELWFAQGLRDAFALSHAGGYQPLKQILAAELPRTLEMLKIKADSDQRSQVMKTLGELDLHDGAKEAFELLAKADYEIVALTNGSKNATHKLLERAGVQEYFTQVYSCDAIAVAKPHRDVYQMIQNDLEQTWLVAAHAWDIAGGIRVGMKTVFVRHLEKEYLDAYPRPQITVDNLLEAARQIIDAR